VVRTAIFAPKADMSSVAIRELYQQQNFLPLHECSSALELKRRGFNQDVALSLEVNSTHLGCQLFDAFYVSYLS